MGIELHFPPIFVSILDNYATFLVFLVNLWDFLATIRREVFFLFFFSVLRNAFCWASQNRITDQ